MIGKWTREAVYVHRSAWKLLPPWQRERIRQAERLSGHRTAALAKIRHDKPVVSLLDYPTFETDLHPALFRAYTVDLAQGAVRQTRYGAENPPILHRKEEFVGPSHPRRAAWAALTAAEEECGLYPKDKLSKIGFRAYWTPMWRRAQPCLRQRLGKARQ